jgi:predicted dehydrogenase/nucleoside-diphosphate-sugar epimerase
MTSGPVRLGIVGCGAVTRKCHLPALPAVPGLALTALVDSHPGRAAEAARLAAGPPGGPVTVTSELEDALGSIDAAVVCTSNASHAGVTARLLRAGKHVLVEKPLAITTGDCGLLAGLASARGLVLAVGHVRRLFPVAVWAGELLASGAIGQPQRVRWHEGDPFGWPVASAAVFQPGQAGGGVVLDIGVHVFDLLMSWFGPDASVAGYADDYAGGVESEATVKLLAGGVAAEVVLSRQRPLGSFCEITGSGGGVRVDIGLPASYQIRSRSGQIVRGGTVPPLPPAEASWRGLYEGQLRRFARAIRDGSPPLAGAAEGTRAVALVQECYAARGGAGERGKPGHSWARFEAPAGALPSGRVAVTGAAGFVGARLVEALAAATDAQVLAIAHSLPGLARLSPLDQRKLAFAAADLGTAGGLAELLAGVDTVVHCAYGSRGSDSERWRTTVAGTQAVVSACQAAGTRRLVHVSSVSVYQPAAGSLTEASSLLAADSADLGYEQQKLAAETLVTAAAPSLEVVVVQPTVIYGPFGPRWTVSALQRLAGEPGLLPSGGGGICNAVYVDDVVSALLLAAAAPGAAGERFIVTGQAPVSWGEFYDRYRDMLVVERSSGAVRKLPDWEQAMYAQQARFSSEKAGKVLGYQPTFGLDQGMARVRDWARWFGLVRTG